MSAPDTVRNLVERFERNHEQYRSGKYNETQLRREFLDPFFEALGWDIFNKQGYAETYKDVIHEDSLEIEGATKAPDYAFRVGGQRKFFVEAKKPSVNIENNIYPAFQLRRYAWSAKLPLGILTDFQEFAVYDCRVKPDKGDKASVGRVMLLSYKDYVEKWDELVSIFSRDAVLKGSFDSYAEGMKTKKGTTEVDDAFLSEIERWRDLLAKNIALRNQSLSVRELNYAVQMTIDRIVFLRICEDRGVERDEQLKEIASGNEIYKGLVQLFQKADARYNSGLFHFKDEKEQSSSADSLTLGLNLDDKPLRDILLNLYYPDSPYVFREIPSDILGQVYERFLGKVIRLTAGHQAKVEDKPEVRKAGGVFYTPTYIVNYIVQNTVGKLLEGKTPKDAEKLRILDPACGSGTFPLGAYQYLLDWHLAWYINHDPEKIASGRNPAIFQSKDGWLLTTSKKKEILLNNIYGVDIDAQAVEVTKLSLLLKVLEGESQETIGSQLSLLQERVLPDLSKNIQCGNSLIGPDYYENHQLTMGFGDDEERYRVNAFDWNGAFSQVFIQGGFDAVIGNPPYVRQEGLGDAKEYFQKHYKTFVPTADLYVNFIEKELGLLKKSGLFGMIVSNKWLRTAYGEPLREFLKNQATILQVVDLAGLPVFEGATVRTLVLICSPNPSNNDIFYYLAPPQISEFRKIKTGEDVAKIFSTNSTPLYINSLNSKGWSFSNSNTSDLIEKLRQNSLVITEYLKDKPYFGIKTGFNKAFVIDRTTRDNLIALDSKSSEIIKPLLGGKEVRRYSIEYAEKYLIWTYIGVPIENYPAIFTHLKQFQSELQKRSDQGNYWWELRACDYYDKFEKSKIIYPDIATNCRFFLDEQGFFGSNTTYFIPGRDLFLLGILNSLLAQFYFVQVCAGLEGSSETYLRFFGQYIQNFPVRPSEKSQRDKIALFAERMLSLQKKNPRTPQEQEMVKREIESTDRAIDKLVYELYGLSEEEIKIVESK